MRPYSYKREEIERVINKVIPKYLIVGFKSDGLRGIPAKYNLVIDMASDGDEVYDKISRLELNFKIFSVGAEPMTSQDWIKAVAALKETKSEREERELYEKLKKKYEK
jgi:hypothetical protein